MKKLTSIIILSLLIMCNYGCQEQYGSSTKKDRLVGSENIRLKKELQQCKGEMAKQIELLEHCQQEKEKIQQGADSSLKFLMDVSSGTEKENKLLKARITELESQ